MHRDKLKFTQRDFSPRKKQLELALLSMGIVGLIVAIQIHMGSYSAEIVGDGTSHYITGLLVHDYIKAGFPSPLVYLKTFHSHYPLVGIGHWGPVYYAVQAVWMLLFSTGRTSVLLLTASITAGTAVALYAFCRSWTSLPFALLAALAFIAMPVVQESSGEVMLDIPIALLCFIAMWIYVKYVETGRAAFSALFGLIASVAMLVKGNAGCLVLLPPLTVLLERRFDLLIKPSFWLPIPIVATLSVPWYLFTYGLVAAGFRYHWGLVYTTIATATNFQVLRANAGPLLITLALLGAFDALRRGRKVSRLTGPLALFLSVWIFQTVIPVALQGRYLVPLMPPLIILAIRGAQIGIALISTGIERLRLEGRYETMISLVMVLILGLSILSPALAAKTREYIGFSELAHEVWRQRIPSNPSVLIVTNNDAEGTAIAELAMNDPQRPSIFAIRGSRLLGAGGYNNQDYLPRFKTAEEIMREIDNYDIPLVLFRSDPTVSAWAHIGLAQEAQRLYPDRWELIYRNREASPEISLYRIRGNARKTADLKKLLALSAPQSPDNKLIAPK
jgi:hypothetical protein